MGISSRNFRNSHFLRQISPGASIAKPWLDQMTPWEVSEGEKAGAGTLLECSVLSEGPSFPGILWKAPRIWLWQSLTAATAWWRSIIWILIPSSTRCLDAWSQCDHFLCSRICGIAFLRLKQRYLYLLKPCTFVFISAFIHFTLFPRQDFHWLTPWEIQDEAEAVPVKSRSENSSASFPVLFYGNQGSKQEPFVVSLWEVVWQDKLSH